MEKGIDKSAQRAFEVYPKTIVHHTKLTTRKSVEIDVNEPSREIYLEGYHQAEKDLELTWEDMEFIVDLYAQVPQYSEWDLIEKEDFFKEVLKRFNEERNKL